MSSRRRRAGRRLVAVRQHSQEELVEEWNGEGRVPMGRAVDHSLGDETGPARSDRFDPDPERGRDIAGTVAAGSEDGHGSKVVLLLRCQPVEPDAEEVTVQRVDDARPGRTDVVVGNRTRRRPRSRRNGSTGPSCRRLADRRACNSCRTCHPTFVAGDTERVDQVVAADQGRRACSGAGLVRVLKPVHIDMPYHILCMLRSVSEHALGTNAIDVVVLNKAPGCRNRATGSGVHFAYVPRGTYRRNGRQPGFSTSAATGRRRRSSAGCRRAGSSPARSRPRGAA